MRSEATFTRLCQIGLIWKYQNCTGMPSLYMIKGKNLKKKTERQRENKRTGKGKEKDSWEKGMPKNIYSNAKWTKAFKLSANRLLSYQYVYGERRRRNLGLGVGIALIVDRKDTFGGDEKGTPLVPWSPNPHKKPCSLEYTPTSTGIRRVPGSLDMCKSKVITAHYDSQKNTLSPYPWNGRGKPTASRSVRAASIIMGMGLNWGGLL